MPSLSKRRNWMSASTLTAPVGVHARPETRRLASTDPAYQGYLLLRIGFALAPVLFGLDKFFNVMVNWEQHLAPWINNIVPGSAADAMHVVGIVEIAAGLLVALKPRYGAYVVAAWLGGIIVDLLSYSGYYDIALRDFGLMLGALTLGRLASKFDRKGIGLGVRG
jgi:uncharacterized membrane protein YphA (DoxX/SURF4 family)